MNRTEQTELFKQFTDLQSKVMFAKSEDYASESDVLSNFKKSGRVLDQTAAQNTLNLIQVKVTRLSELVNKSKRPLNESVRDSLIDLANYTFLMHCCLFEQGETEYKAAMEARLIESTPLVQQQAMMLMETNTKLQKQLDVYKAKEAKHRKAVRTPKNKAGRRR